MNQTTRISQSHGKSLRPSTPQEAGHSMQAAMLGLTSSAAIVYTQNYSPSNESPGDFLSTCSGSQG